MQPSGDEQYEVLNVLGFSSDRRRMSVIMRCPNRRIRLFTKGAVSCCQICFYLHNFMSIYMSCMVLMTAQIYLYYSVLKDGNCAVVICQNL